MPERQDMRGDAVARRDLVHRDDQPAITQAQQQCSPALGRFTEALLDGQEVLAAVTIAADDHQHTAPLGGAHVDVDAIRPEIHHLVAAPIALAECVVLVLPAGFQATDRRCRQAFDRVPEQRLERFVEIVGRYTLEIQPR